MVLNFRDGRRASASARSQHRQTDYYWLRICVDLLHCGMAPCVVKALAHKVVKIWFSRIYFKVHLIKTEEYINLLTTKLHHVERF